jgi:hypothetical protein
VLRLERQLEQRQVPLLVRQQVQQQELEQRQPLQQVRQQVQHQLVRPSFQPWA